MRRLTSLAVLVSFLATTGCASREASYGALAFGTFSLAGAAYAESQIDESLLIDPTAFLVMLGVVVGTIAVSAGGLGLLRAASHKAKPVPETETDEAPGVADPLAGMTAQAARYARAGDCVRAQMVVDEIRESDEAYYRNVVAPDPVIGACFPR